MAPPMSPAAAEVRILHSEPSHAIAFLERTLVVLWQTETRKEAVLELALLLARLAEEPGRLALIQVIGDHAISPDGDTRAALAKMLKANETRIVASAVVFEGSGFRASMIRSVVIGISLLSRPKCPHTVFASTAEGTEWLSGYMKSNGSPHYAPDRVRLAIDDLRQCIRLVST